MTYEERLKINKLKNMIYGNYDLNFIIKELEKYLDKENEDENIVELTLGKAYYEKKDFIKSINYLRAAYAKNKNCTYYFLGLFKNYAMLSDFKDAYKYLLQYKEVMEAKGHTISYSLFEKIYNYNLTGNFEVLDYNDTMLFISLDNIQAKQFIELYNQIITYYNMKYFDMAHKTCIKFNEYCKKNKIYLDFNPVTKLLEDILNKKYPEVKENLSEYYKKLEQAKNENNCEEIIKNLKVTSKYSLKRIELIFQSINIIVKNGYCEEAKEIVEQMSKFILNKFILELLQNNIANQEKYLKLDEEQKNVYHKSISLGHSYYEMQDYITAYDIYSWGYYITNDPIFLYYIGKMLYKIDNYEEAEKYFKEYLKNGSTKAAKAYIYLSAIEKRKPNKKKKVSLIKTYNDYSGKVSNLFGEDFELLQIYDKEQDDVVKLKLLNNEIRKRIAD